MKTAIFINNAAGYYSAKTKWEKVRDKVLQTFSEEPLEICYDGVMDFDSVLPELIQKQKIEFFVAGGGDGTHNFLLNALCKETDTYSRKFCIGSIGLGSSNDNQKPYNSLVQNIPIRIDYEGRQLHDIGKVFIHHLGDAVSHYFCVNASFGLTAQANELFNQSGYVINLLKKRNTGASIIYTAIKSLQTHKSNQLSLTYKGIKVLNEYNSINVVLKPYVSGGLHFPEFPKNNGSLFALYLLCRMNKMQLLKTMNELLKGKFNRNENKHLEFISSLEVQSQEEIPLELDGEIYYGNKFEFNVDKNKIYMAV